MKYVFTILLVTCGLIAAVNTPRAQEAKPENPLDQPGKACGGVWISEEGIANPKGKYTKSRSEWGVNKKCIRSKAWAVDGGKETLVFEGGVYWHPVAKVLQYWAVDSTGSAWEGTVKPEDGKLISRWKVFGDWNMEGESHAEYADNDNLTTKEYLKQDGKLKLFKTLKMVRKPDGWTGLEDEDKDGQDDAAPAEEKPSSLAETGKMVGGKWVTEGGVKDPKSTHVYFTSEWGVNNKLLCDHTWRVKDGKATQFEEGNVYWHPGRKELIFVQVTESGAIFLGAITDKDGTYVWRFTAYGEKGEAEFIQTVKYTDDDTMESKVVVKKEGEWKPAMELKFLRKPIDWPKESD